MRAHAWLLLGLLPLGACARAGVERPAPVPIPIVEYLPNDVHWFRNAAEYRAIAYQTWALAADRLRERTAGRERGSWAVILDADETILDNSEYQRRIVLRGARFEIGTWNAWVRERRAAAVPGAVPFLQLIHALGGRIAIVTNRDEEVCPDTRLNLDALDMPYDVVLCRPPGVSDKNPRFAAVANGTAAAGLPPLDVVMWVGDNIQDFPSLSQDVRHGGADAFASFGRTFIVLPNPMYGSWERNEHR